MMHSQHRLAYSLPGPPTPVALTAVSGVLELVVLLAALALNSRQQQEVQQEEQQQQQQLQGERQQPQDGERTQRDGMGLQPADDGKGSGDKGAADAGSLPWGLPAALLAGAEIG